MYHNDLKYCLTDDWTNSVDTDQTAHGSSLIRVYSVCHFPESIFDSLPIEKIRILIVWAENVQIYDG